MATTGNIIVNIEMQDIQQIENIIIAKLKNESEATQFEDNR